MTGEIVYSEWPKVRMLKDGRYQVMREDGASLAMTPGEWEEVFYETKRLDLCCSMDDANGMAYDD